MDNFTTLQSGELLHLLFASKADPVAPENLALTTLYAMLNGAVVPGGVQ